LIQVSARRRETRLLGAFLPEASMPLPRKRAPPSEIQRPICIIDDDESVVDSLKALLEAFGFNVQSYGSGNEFLADARHRAASCLVTDQHMPGMSGLDVIDHLQEEGVKVPAILISARLDAGTRKRAARLGVRELVDKPFAAGCLVELIRAALAENS
jgi:two-component system response regulator FixJ